jgi:hypothetical protein
MSGLRCQVKLLEPMIEELGYAITIVPITLAILGVRIGLHDQAWVWSSETIANTDEEIGGRKSGAEATETRNM